MEEGVHDGIWFLRAALENVHAPGLAEKSPSSSDITLLFYAMGHPPRHPHLAPLQTDFCQQHKYLQACGALREYQPVG